MNLIVEKNKNEECNTLYEYLTCYNNITIKLIELVENEQYDILDQLINDRQKLIENMKKINYTKEEFKHICGKFKMLIIEQKLNSLMNQQKAKLRSELNKISISKNANKTYKRGYAVDSIFFNKKI